MRQQYTDCTQAPVNVLSATNCSGGGRETLYVLQLIAPAVAELLSVFPVIRTNDYILVKSTKWSNTTKLVT
jgi:hypothetical protein